MKAKAHFVTPTIVLHIDKHYLPVTFWPQSASPPPPPRRPPLTLASAGPRTNFKKKSFFCWLFPPPPLHILRAFSVSLPFVTSYLCITHLFLIISSLIFQFSLSVSATLSSASLKAFHLSTICMPGHTSSVRLNSYLLLCTPSSPLFPILVLYLSAQPPLASSPSVPSPSPSSGPLG